MQKIIILGAGGHAREILDIFISHNLISNKYEVIGFIEENTNRRGILLNGYPILGGFDWFDTFDTNEKSNIKVICAVGDPSIKRKLVEKAIAYGLEFCNIIHPTAILTSFVRLGKGVVITAGCILTNQIEIGDHVHINLNCTISHDCKIEDFCTISPGVNISGNVHIKTGCFIGTGAAIIQGITIDEWSIIGAGAVVVKDIPPNTTAVGVPARVIKQREPGWYLK